MRLNYFAFPLVEYNFDIKTCHQPGYGKLEVDIISDEREPSDNFSSSMKETQCCFEVFIYRVGVFISICIFFYFSEENIVYIVSYIIKCQTH